jgi:hypothetical protein
VLFLDKSRKPAPKVGRYSLAADRRGSSAKENEAGNGRFGDRQRGVPRVAVQRAEPKVITDAAAEGHLRKKGRTFERVAARKKE